MSKEVKNKYIPKNYNHSILLKIHSPNKEDYKPKEYKVYQLLAMINELYPMQENQRLLYGDYTYISATKLKHLFGNDYKATVDWLVKADVFKTDNQYINGKKCKGFSFTDSYADATPKKVTICKGSLVRKLSKKSNSSYATEKKYGFLYKYLDGLEIDVEGASECAWSMYKQDKLEYSSKLAKYELKVASATYKSKSLKKPANPTVRLTVGLDNIDRIDNKDFGFTQDSTAYRVHTNLTNIKSELRNYVTYNGQPIVSVDFANSQPMLSTTLLSPVFWNTDATATAEMEEKILKKGLKPNILNNSDILPSVFSDIITMSCNPFSYTSYIMFTKTGIPPVSIAVPVDIQRYIDLCQSGDLYKFLSKEMQLEQQGIADIDGRGVKAAVFQVLFTDNRFLGQADAKPKRIFKELFPSVYDILFHIKRNDSTVLPITLQIIESTIILNRVAKRISIERPNLFITTIHDSVATTLGNEDYVEQVMREEMIIAIGLEPSFKVDYWSADNPITIKKTA
ncbi:MAG: Uncharacterised protein [Flavobacteriaceae bacterium]|jgi:hypothetical protein|nr:MAG: Uncharacterised protein [Flavobacteriaceae bacterium]|tara:strand:+ start:1826 stop:3358 length:1533 start_codon:yes stop_codon:yes gene_type:complete